MHVADCVTLQINGSTKNFFLLEIILLLIETLLSSFLRGIFIENNFFIFVLNSLNIKSNKYLFLKEYECTFLSSFYKNLECKNLE